MRGVCRLKAILGLSSAMAAIVVAPLALAQDEGVQTSEPDAEAIIVTGFRASLNSALNIKRTETATIDAIKAEDIAEFPDLNLAESLQRIPGVAISRVNGEGRNISVRGLGPEYTRVRINGMEAIGTTGGTDNSGGVNRGRGFDFNIFSSDLFSNLSVRKTATADVEEGSLGGTVDLQTSRPLDYRKPTAVVSAAASYNDLSEKTTPRLSALAATQTEDGRFGALISVTYEERRIKEEGANITRWTYGGFNNGFNPASTLPGYTIAQINDADPETALFHPRIPGLVSYDISQKRLGAAGSLQFKSSSTQISIDGLYSMLDGTRREAQLQAISFSRSGSGKPQTIIRDGVVDADNNIISGRFDNVDLRSQARYDVLKTEFYQVTGNIEHQFSTRLKFSALAGYSSSEFKNPVQTTVTIDAINTGNYQYDFSSRFPLIQPGVDVANPSTWSFINGTSEVRIRPQTVSNAFTTAKGALEWEALDGVTLKAGMDWRKFEYGSTERRRLSGETVVSPLTSAQLAGLTTLHDGFGKGLNVPDGTPTAWVVPNLDAFISQGGIYSNPLYATGGIENATARGSFITVREEDTGAWGMAQFNLDDNVGVPIRGDIGVRYVHTNQFSTGYASQGSSINLVTAERSYNRWLPSLNLVGNITDTLQVRFAAAKTLARAGIASLTPGGNLNVSGGNRSFSSGNPDLKPTSSKNLDVSIEWYPMPGAIYAISGFRKDIGSFAQTLSVGVPYSSLGLPDALLTGTTASPGDIFIVSQPVNSDGGILKGFEINVQQPLSFLPGILSNFGILANYTYVQSNIEYLTSASGSTSVRAPLVGLSKQAANGTLYFETKKFQIRGSLAYRSKYLTAVPGTEGNSYNGTNSTLNVDAQASYNLTENLKVSLEAINLTDTRNDQFVDETNRLNVLTHSGRQFNLGVRYSF